MVATTLSRVLRRLGVATSFSMIPSYNMAALASIFLRRFFGKIAWATQMSLHLLSISLTAVGMSAKNRYLVGMTGAAKQR
jgi:cytolysin (calcineurin-like family phosphatase)